jgi:outer membrane protein assembly factor BamB
VSLVNPRSLLVTAVVAAAIGSSGCAGLKLGTRDRPDLNQVAPALRHDLARFQWRAPLVVATDLESHPRNRVIPAVDPERGLVYVGGLDSGIHALRADDGLPIWRFQTLGPVEGAVVLDRGMVFVGCNDGALYALDALTGVQRWRFATTAEVVRAPIVTADTVFLVNADDTVFAVNRGTGEQRWRYHREPPGGITASGHAGLLSARGKLYTGFADGTVVALDPGDGTATWERDTAADAEESDATEAHRVIDVDTTPVLLEGSLFVASQSTGLYSLDPEGGGVRWRIDWMTAVSSLASAGRYLYATSSTLGLLKIDPSDGSVLWARDYGSGAMQVMDAGGGLLMVPSASQALWLVRARDGEVLEGLGRGGVTGMPVRAGNWIFFGTNLGALQAYRLITE